MNRSGAFIFVALAVACVSVHGAGLRSLKQANPASNTNNGAVITVTASTNRIDAIAITPVLPYPQTNYYCNVSGDSRLAVGAFFPLTVKVPVGVTATVVFANITGVIPGTNGTGGSGGSGSVVQQSGSSVVQQGGSSVVQQPGSSVVQQPGSSVVQQPGTSVVQQPGTSVVQQPGTSVVQQPGSSVVQQPGSSVVQQPGSSVVQQPGSSVVQQPNTTSSVVQQPGSSVVQQPGSSVVQQPGSSVVQQPGSSVVQQPGSSVVQQPGSSVVQQPTGTTSIVQQQQGRRLLQTPAPVEYISNNGSTGQPQLSVLDTVEGVPNIAFTPTAAGQTASFRGALQVAVTTTNDGFGTPFIPYKVDPKLSPNCQLLVNFVTA